MTHGNRGARPRSEYRDTTTPRRGVQPEPIHRETGSWPELRIVRQASITAAENEPWKDYLDELGQTAYGVGQARSLGSVAIVYVPAKDMGIMMQDKNNRRDNSRHAAVRRCTELAGSFIDFSRGQFANAYDNQTNTHAAAHSFLDQALHGFEFSNELDTTENVVDPAVYSRTPQPRFAELPVAAQSFELLLDAAVNPEDIPTTTFFGPADFEVGGVKIFGKDGLGLDLDANEQIHEERLQVLDFLKGNGFNTSRVSPVITAHATIFNYEQHRMGEVIQSPVVTPPVIAFNPPKAIVN